MHEVPRVATESEFSTLHEVPRVATESDFSTLHEVPRVATGVAGALGTVFARNLVVMRRSKSATGPPMSADHPSSVARSEVSDRNSCRDRAGAKESRAHAESWQLTVSPTYS